LMAAYEPLPTSETQEPPLPQQYPAGNLLPQQQFPPTFAYPPAVGGQEYQKMPPQDQQVKMPSPPDYNMYAAAPGTPFLYSTPEQATPHDPERIKEYLLAREYSLDTGRYIKESWAKYKECWWGYSGLFVLFLLVNYIPYCGGLLAWPLLFGYFLATAHSVRNGTPVEYPYFFNGYYFYGPLFIIQFLYTLAMILGFLLLIIPGVWAMVAFAFSTALYLEYRTTGLKMVDCMKISYKVVNKNFCSVFGYFIVMFFFALSGILLLGVGALVTIPIAYISLVYCFDDMFGLNRSSNQIATECVTC